MTPAPPLPPRRTDAPPIRLTVCSGAPSIGGAENSLATLLRHLDRRFTVTVVAADRDVAELLAAQRAVEQVKIVAECEPQAGFRGLPRLIAAFADTGADVIHLNRTWIWDRPTAILAGAMTRRARLVTVEHSQPLASQSWAQRFRRHWLAKRIDALVAVSHTSARGIEECLGLPTGAVHTIHNGVEAAEARPAARPLNDPPTIGAIGRLSWEKGYEDLPKILAQVANLHAILVGDGPDRARIENLARREGVRERLELVGWQDDANAWLHRFDLLVAPSRAEGSPPLAALEAMMASVPVIAADVGAVAEAVTDRETGLLVPPRDPNAMAVAVEELLRDGALRARLAKAGHERVRVEFRAETMARRFEDLYDELVAGRP